MASLGDRMIRAAKLDRDLYEEVEADTGATGQAMLVVVLSSELRSQDRRIPGYLHRDSLETRFVQDSIAWIGNHRHRPEDVS